ncbi:MAG: sigma-70 family RNA polymerase sigma factor [Streptosporangiaceae bacterium]
MSDSRSRSGCLSSQPQLDALIMSVGHGEANAFDALYRELSGLVYRTALSVLRDPAQAEEVAQEVHLEVWRTAGRFDPARGTAEAWVTTIARRRAIDRVRSAVADMARDRRDGRIGSSWDQVSEAVQEILDRERLSYSLDRLSGPQRQVIMLAFYGGHTYTEIAVILGLAVGTVKSRIRAGLSAMRESMRTSYLARQGGPFGIKRLCDG